MPTLAVTEVPTAFVVQATAITTLKAIILHDMYDSQWLRLWVPRD